MGYLFTYVTDRFKRYENVNKHVNDEMTKTLHICEDDSKMSRSDCRQIITCDTYVGGMTSLSVSIRHSVLVICAMCRYDELATQISRDNGIVGGGGDSKRKQKTKITNVCVFCLFETK